MCMYALSNVYVYTPGLYSIYSTVYSIDDGVLYLFYPPHFCCHQAHIFRQGTATSAQPTGGLPAT